MSNSAEERIQPLELLLTHAQDNKIAIDDDGESIWNWTDFNHSGGQE